MKSLIQLLKDDHKEVRALYEKIKSLGPGAPMRRKELYNRFRVALTAHAKTEEAVLYEFMKEHKQLRSLALEGYEEHHVTDLLMNELSELSPDDERWMAKLEVLTEALEHHIKEEESQFFSMVQKHADLSALKAMGGDYLERKHALLETGKLPGKSSRVLEVGSLYADVSSSRS